MTGPEHRNGKPPAELRADAAIPTPADDATLAEPLLTPTQAAALLAVRTSWIYEAVRAGRLPCVRIGRHLRFLRSDLARWVRAQRSAGR
jgi:excisionase family DNA binding protein